MRVSFGDTLTNNASEDEGQDWHGEINGEEDEDDEATKQAGMSKHQKIFDAFMLES